MRPLLLFVCLFFCMPTLSLAENFIGSVITITGKGFVVREGKLQPMEIGRHILQDDVLVTVKNSTMGVIFRDNTQLALGPETELLIDEFVFNPTHNDLSFIAKMRTGTAAFLTGKLAKLAPERMIVETPLSTIGIRGTSFVVRVAKEEQ